MVAMYKRTDISGFPVLSGEINDDIKNRLLNSWHFFLESLSDLGWGVGIYISVDSLSSQYNQQLIP